MNITVNGTERTLDDGSTIADLIGTLGLADERIAVELNRAIVRREKFGEHVLTCGDTVEIVQFVGGG